MNNWTSFSNSEDTYYKENTICNYDLDSTCINWQITNEQKYYYVQQFKKIIPPNCYKLPGSVAKEFFELSKLSIEDLRNIWELADQDKDGYLKLGEFCVAMHLVVLRKNGLIIPRSLPTELIPYMNLSFKELESLGNTQCEEKSNVSLKKASYSNLLKKLPSDASLKSDALSLTEGMTAFDSKPPEGDKVTYPVPFKPVITNIECIPPTIVKPVGPKTLLIEAESYKYDMTNPMELQDNSINTKNESEVVMKTPPVPPRYRWSHKSVENSNSYSTIDEDAHPNDPLLDTTYLANKSALGIDFSLSPTSIVMSLNAILDSDERKDAYNCLISTTKMQCDSLASSNQEMSRNLKQLQQQRISLEIQLEKMMPLKYVS